MASLTTVNQVFTNSGVPFEGVLRLFPNGSSPMFGAVLQFEFTNGFITAPTPSPTFVDDEFCFQWIHFATLTSASSTPQVCQYVGMVQGPTEVVDLQQEMMTFDQYTSALAMCRNDLQSLMLQIDFMQGQIDSCQGSLSIAQGVIDQQTEEINDCNQSLQDARNDNDLLQDQLSTQQQALEMCQESLETALEQLQQMTTEQEIMDQMVALRASSSGQTTIRLPQACPETGGMTQDQQHELMQRMAGYGQTKESGVRVSNSTGASAAEAAAKLRADKEEIATKLSAIGKSYKPASLKACKKVSPQITQPAPVVPDNLPTPEKLDDIKARMEAMKTCGN